MGGAWNRDPRSKHIRQVHLPGYGTADGASTLAKALWHNGKRQALGLKVQVQKQFWGAGVLALVPCFPGFCCGVFFFLPVAKWKRTGSKRENRNGRPEDPRLEFHKHKAQIDLIRPYWGACQPHISVAGPQNQHE